MNAKIGDGRWEMGDSRTRPGLCRRPSSIFYLLSAIFILAGCAVGPNYHRHPVNSPDTFRGEAEPSTNSFADLPWWQIFHDTNLQDLVRVALTNNYDLRIAFA